jgi:ATP-dependent Lhr-like helicase
VLLALWDLVWAGRVTNDTLAPLRALQRRRAIRISSARLGRATRRRSARPGHAAAAGRWSLTPAREPDPTRRLHAWAEQLLRRHGIVTRGVAVAERVPGGFAAVYPVLKAFEESGRCRRGYFVEGLGGAQFALPGAVDRMRALAAAVESESTAVLPAADPANPYGAALPWPERPAEDGGHRPGRKAGAVVVLVDGRLVLYVERGGRTVLSYSDDATVLGAAVEGLARAASAGMLGKLELERADGEAVEDTPLAKALLAAGFQATWRGLRLRA